MYFNNIEKYKIEALLNPHYPIYAHKKEDKYELLSEHISLCEKYFLLLIKEKNLERVFERLEQILTENLSEGAIQIFREMIINVISLHDIGKLNPCFQKMQMQNDLQIPLKNMTNSNHSLLSSIIYMDLFVEKIKKFEISERNILLDIMILNAYVISRHHGHLHSLEDFTNQFWIRDGCKGVQGQGKKLLEYERALFQETYGPELHLSVKTIQNVFKISKQCKSDKERGICREIYIRFMLSLLFACDFYATSEFMDDIEIKDLGTLDDISIFSKLYESGAVYKSIREYEKNCYGKSGNLGKVEDINILRNELFLDAEKEMLKNIAKNIFYLEAPTGSGKSNVALNLSFQMLANDTYKKKIIYVYPFNTLVEQNLKTLENHFETNCNVMDYIAVINSVEPIKTDKKQVEDAEKNENTPFEYYKKALLNRQFLNYPMILTTHVSLFNYLFGTGKEAIFPFHQIANSVIVLDEIQSYKNSIWGEIITFLSCYADVLNIKIIIMSATLPELDLLTLRQGETVRLIVDREKYFSNRLFKNRVDVDYSLLQSQDIEEDLFQHVVENSRKDKKILVEFINKIRAYEFYSRLKDEKRVACEVLLMTGDDNMAERERILSSIKENAKKTLILIATQVIEAGVDIDMDIGYKNISLLDSEEQFLGRINRSCKRNGCKVYFFELDLAKKIYLNDVRVNSELTLKSEGIQEILCNKDFSLYYRQIIHILKKQTSGINEANIHLFFDEVVGSLDFLKIEAHMELIRERDNQISVYLSRTITDCQGRIVDGEQVWDCYKKLLADENVEYAEKRVRLSEVRAQMNQFIYYIKGGENLIYNDRIGELFFIADGDSYFENGKLNREKFKTGIGEFI